jgi:exodeoxyribonuclease-3
MKIITFNVNGLRSILCKTKDGSKSSKPVTQNVLTQLLQEQTPDVLCLQEVRCPSSIDLSPLNLENLGYDHVVLNCSTSKKGYSGTAVIAKVPPQETFLGFPHQIVEDASSELNTEGRMITCVFSNTIVINVYVPNSKQDLSRLDFRIQLWETSVSSWVSFLQQRHPEKTILLCGDLNVAHDSIDVHNPSTAKGAHGFTDEERNALSKLLNKRHLVDTFRVHHPFQQKYSWFSPLAQNRKRNKGWRIDYVLASQNLRDKILSADVLNDYFGSDHVPCMTEFDAIL